MIVFVFVSDDGKVMKALNAAAPDNDTVDTVLVDEIQVLPVGIPIKNLHVVHLADPRDDKLVVLTDDEIQSIRLHRCDHRTTQSCRQVCCIVEYVSHVSFESKDFYFNEFALVIPPYLNTEVSRAWSVKYSGMANLNFSEPNVSVF